MSAQVTLQQQFEILPYSVNEIGSNGSGRIQVQVHGFWSEVASIYVSRDYKWDRKADATAAESYEWKVTATHSSGGRDTNQQADDIVAERCFAHAILALTEVAAQLREAVPYMEAAFQVRRAKDRAAQAEAEAKKQAEAEADTALGENGAKALLATLEGNARNQMWVKHFALAFKRGTDKPYKVSAECNGDRVTFRSAGSVISRKKLVAELAATSARAELVIGVAA